LEDGTLSSSRMNFYQNTSKMDMKDFEF